MEGKEFSKIKNDLSDALVATICPIGKKIKNLKNDQSYLLKILHEGTERANSIAEKNLDKVKEIMGFVLH
jgi:tryptophanyl-tRNA synthetase